MCVCVCVCLGYVVFVWKASVEGILDFFEWCEEGNGVCSI